MAKKDKKKNGPDHGGRISCMLLSSASALLGRGLLESAPDDPVIRVTLLSGDPDALKDAEIAQVVPTVRNLPPRIGRLILRRGDELTLESLRGTGAAMRQNFRMPVDFESFLYPRGGGRAGVKAQDLSCGGMAMYAAAELDVGEVCEVVIPITAEGPLILDCEILRRRPGGPAPGYAAKFLDLIHDQEALLREAVFQAQLQSLALKR